MDVFKPGGFSKPTTSVEISVSCRNLYDSDYFSKSDPMCVVFMRQPMINTSWFEIGRTETITNCLSPEFAKKFTVDYFFEERQYLKFEIYDVDCDSRDLSKQDFLGRFECTLGELVANQKLEKPLQYAERDQPHKAHGSIILVAEELGSCKEEMTLQFSAKKLDKKDWFGSSDPFLSIYRTAADGSLVLVHKTEVIKNNLNPVWKPFTKPLNALCWGGDRSRIIVIRCLDWNSNGSEKLIGECQTSVSSLVESAVMAPADRPLFDLVNSKYLTKKGYKSSGTLHLTECRVELVHSFMDFVAAGTQLNCTVAIDFTASNGNPVEPTSLHYIHPHQPNLYTRALQAVGEIIQDYDSDKLFPVLGFGARLPPSGTVSHEFFVNGNPTNPFCQGIGGVIDAYQMCLRSVQLYGPTNFAPIINHVARFAAAKRDGSEYFILLMLTDGVIMDMPLTKEAIVNASSLPMSIIIVGIGNEDFEAMHVLDGDEVRVSSNGRPAVRDIVQFVAFRDFLPCSGAPVDLQFCQTRLAKEVLAEIPEQFLSYMKTNRIEPGSWPKPHPQQPHLGATAPTAPVNGAHSAY